MTHPNEFASLALRDRPETEKAAYLAGSLGFFLAAGFAFFGSGGIASIRFSTASIGSALGFGSALMVGG
jgi:hypothetical protein